MQVLCGLQGIFLLFNSRYLRVIGPELKNISEEVANKMGMLPIPLKGVKEDCIATGISIYWCINSKSDDKVKKLPKNF